MIEVIAPGARTTIQDRGRFGYREMGVGPAGPFDALAACAATLAVGNDPDAALLEITMTGPTLRFRVDAVVAVAGARITSTPTVPSGEPFPIRAGDTLTLGRIREGVRTYLAIRGGIDVAPVLGSRSTHVASGIGPPVLTSGAQLMIGTGSAAEPRRAQQPAPSPVVRVIGLDPSLRAGFDARVDPSSDRIGVRLAADLPLDGGEIDPEPMLPGMIQLPPGGAPIVLGPDAPTTGGYVTIGTVARVDLGILAQARPGQALRFGHVDEDEARLAWNEVLACLEASI